MIDLSIFDRRELLKGLSVTVGGAVLLPTVVNCAGSGAMKKRSDGGPPVPLSRPPNWDPIAFNRARGNAGFIPDSYLGSINGPDGETKHLGKHLPFIVEAEGVPAGYVALMWGDPARGYARHPNAPASQSNPQGHWYNWIRVRKAFDGEAQQLESRFSNWPEASEADNGAYLVLGGGDIAADGGRNTIYLTAIPDDCRIGDIVRIWAHCLTHGEYVDFVTI